MAVIDEARGVLVVRIVYDGPALSGKTTSLRALSRGVGSQVTTLGESAGRTLFFDWVDYVGGLFDGRQIRCQIVSVPGQLELSARRKFLLDTADAVVLVLDTREHEWEFSRQWLQQSLVACRSKDPPVGIVVQANKRDAPDALAADALRESVGRAAPVALVGSTATSGDGIREAFVLAVRLALDRVRALSTRGLLRFGKPDDDAPEELLGKLQDAEQAPKVAHPTAFAASVSEALSAELDTPARLTPTPPASTSVPPSDNAEIPFVPDPMIPGGMIWPPVDGRALLHEVASLDIRPTRSGRSDWCGSGSGFRFHSLGSAVFPDLQSARNQLIEWARLHAANTAHLSAGRAVILADAGSGRLRLWQIVRAEATLRERLASALPLPDPNQVARELLSVAAQLSSARSHFSSTTITLPCTLWTIGATLSSRPSFVGLMPAPNSSLPPEPSGPELIARELSPQLRELRRSRVDYTEVVSRLVSIAERTGRDSPAHWLSHIVQSV